MVKCDECNKDVISYYDYNKKKLCFTCYEKAYETDKNNVEREKLEEQKDTHYPQKKEKQVLQKQLKMDTIKEYKNELNNIEEKTRKIRTLGGIFLLIWVPIFIYNLWIDWDYIQRYGIFEGAIKSLGEPIQIIGWFFCFILIALALSVKNNENKKKDIEEKLKNIKKCPECNKITSGDFKICPNCGYRF